MKYRIHKIVVWSAILLTLILSWVAIILLIRKVVM